MNRNEEFTGLLEELDETPLKLDFTLDRARSKRREHRRHAHRAVFAPLGTFAAVFAPLGTIAAVFAVFVLLVNVSPTFAYAAGRLPVLRDLAKFVAMSPSLSAAVENEYVQPMGLEQSADGITANIEYVIVDQKQLNIFYALSSDTYTNLMADPDISSADESKLEGFSVISGDPGETNDKLRKITVDFAQGTMPDALKLKLRIRKSGVAEASATAAPAKESSLEDSYFSDNSVESEQLTEISFTLSFDPAYTATGENIQLNTPFVLDGQHIILSSVGIYPTHMRFILNDDENNTAWITALSYYVENEKGECFEGISNGISAYGKENSPMLQQFMLESAFFSSSKHLTLHITGVSWLFKNMEKVHVDLKNKTADALPEGVEFISSERYYSGWRLEFTATAFDNISCQVWRDGYFDAQGKRYDFNNYSFTSVGSSYQEGSTNVAAKNQFSIWLPLKDYPYDEVWLCPSYSRHVTLDTPVSIEIK